MMRSETSRALGAGVLASASMLAVYTFLLAWLGGTWRHPVEQFSRYWFWLVPIVAGFGLQVGLWRYLVWSRRRSVGTTAAVSGGTGGLAMAACCAHHLADLLPALGLTAAATVVTRYQPVFFAVAVASNLVGLAVVSRHVWRWPQLTGRFTHLTVMTKSFITPLALGLMLGAAAIGVVLAYNRSPAPPASASSGGFPPLTASPYPARSDQQADVTVTVTPAIVDTGQTTFDVAFNTHSVELDYDFAAVSSLAAGGQRRAAIAWVGGRGGHHLQGRLVFPPLPPGVDGFTLTMSGVGGVERQFSWNVGR